MPGDHAPRGTFRPKLLVGRPPGGSAATGHGAAPPRESIPRPETRMSGFPFDGLIPINRPISSPSSNAVAHSIPWHVDCKVGCHEACNASPKGPNGCPNILPPLDAQRLPMPLAERGKIRPWPLMTPHSRGAIPRFRKRSEREREGEKFGKHWQARDCSYLPY